MVTKTTDWISTLFELIFDETTLYKDDVRHTLDDVHAYVYDRTIRTEELSSLSAIYTGYQNECLNIKSFFYFKLTFDETNLYKDDVSSEAHLGCRSGFCVRSYNKGRRNLMSAIYSSYL